MSKYATNIRKSIVVLEGFVSTLYYIFLGDPRCSSVGYNYNPLNPYACPPGGANETALFGGRI